MNWMPKNKLIVDEIQRETVEDIFGELYPCGCGVKLDLYDVIYPVLDKIVSPKFLKFSKIRVDASQYLGRFKNLSRISLNHHDLIREKNVFENLIKEFSPQSIIEFFSTEDIYTKNPNSCIVNFQNYSDNKFEVFDTLVEKSLETGHILEYGKGHSISGRKNLVVFDFVNYSKDDHTYTIINNDTIITADGLLNHKSMISVYTALNNSLNDLLIYGAIKDLHIYPVYDGTPEDVKTIQRHFLSYSNLFKDNDIDLTIHDLGPLNMGAKLIGATSIGHSQTEIPQLSQLKVGHEIWATRDMGDLSLLNYYKKLLIEEKQIPKELEELRLEVFRNFMTPNIELAKIISSFLPNIGEVFSEEKHVFVSTDASGPGLQNIEDACKLSQVSFVVSDLKFIHKDSLNNRRRNHTSSTNGPLLISAHPKVIEKINTELHKKNIRSFWKIGRVVEKQKERILILKELLNQFPKKNPFAKFSKDNELIFESFKYVDNIKC
ncbi:MAG: hypothetical protein H6625_05660 [Bdellovibrionaceae bacterium]|nr:hypothetical protein [Pseudobdellovibrionaceae bacterium]